MKQSKVALGLILALSVLPIYQVSAEGGWLQKGAGIFNNLGGTKTGTELSSGEIGEAFKEALRIGSAQVVQQLGADDGFNGDPQIHIPLPRTVETAKNLLAKVGMSQIADDLEEKLNRAAEAATPKAKELFLQAIEEMTFADVQQIYRGPKDSATRYFQEKMAPKLAMEMRPIVAESLSTQGAVQAFDNLVANYKKLPFVPDLKANLTDHVLAKGMDGIFYYLAKEEAAIRENPVKQTTGLLKKVFGGA